MKQYQLIKSELEKDVCGRERHNRASFIARLMKEKYMNVEAHLADIITDSESYARIWRKVLEENPHLQGKDYNTKKELSQKKQLELGYIPGFEESIKILNNLLDMIKNIK